MKNSIRNISKGDTALAESFFRKPGGRRYLENITLILLSALVPQHAEKEDMYLGFVEVLNEMEHRIHRQDEGQGILEDVLRRGD